MSEEDKITAKSSKNDQDSQIPEIKLFSDFLKAFKEGKSFLTEENGEIFTKDNIEKAIKPLIDFGIGIAKSEESQKYEKKQKEDYVKLNDKVEKPAYREYYLSKVLFEKEPKRKLIKGEYPKPSFNEKILEQYGISNYLNTLVQNKPIADDTDKLIIAHVLWLRMLPILMKYETKNKLLDNFIPEKKDKIFTKKGLADYSVAKTKVHAEVLFLFDLLYNLSIIKETKPNLNLQEETINFIINYIKNPQDLELLSEEIVSRVPIQNMLLHLCNKDDYEPIAANNIKEKIVAAFDFLIKEKKYGDKKNIEELETDEEIKLIKSKLIDLSQDSQKEFNSFFDKPYIYFWNFDSAAKEIRLDELQALNFKKQIVLYGPPGTSKTYAANEMANVFVNQSLFRYLNDDGRKEYLKLLLNEENEKELYKYFITWRQLHANYGYEDFVRGLRISKGDTKFQEGNFLKLIKKVNGFSVENKFQLAEFIDKDDRSKVPFVLILDEINRTDLSKLFGELFSGLENRGKDIDLPGIDDGSEQPDNINIPKNLYIIGTMNEIDFSVERIDFALRRRFCWYEYNFSKTRLEQIMNEKIKGFEKEGKGIGITNILDFDGLLEQYIGNAEKLNNEIKKNPELGESWQIGHTFFAEVIDVFYQKSNESIAKRINKKKEIKESIEIIWNISIEPMLDAYFVNLDSNSTNISKLKEIFIEPKKSKEKI